MRRILHDLIDDCLFKEDPIAALLDAALQIRRAGLEHLVTRAEATPSAIAALMKAGQIVEAERAVFVARALQSPEDVAAIYDAGSSRIEKACDVVLEAAVRRRSRR